MAPNIFYQTRATATGGRDGQVKTEDGAFSVKLAKPKEMGGTGDGNNPEQLFAAGYAACFLSAVHHVASQKHQKMPESTKVTAQVGIGPRPEGGFKLAVTLEVNAPGIEKNEVEAIVKEAHQICPYSNATRNNIDVKLSVV